MAFKKGQSGNPTGKPKGTRDWRSKLREQLETAGPDIIKSIIARAKSGDPQAEKIIIDRLVPPLKSTSAPVSLDLPAGPAFLARAESVFAAMGEGKVSLDDGAALLGALTALLKVKEVDDLERRITELEKGVTKK